jgi:hypothetical protein
VRLTSAKLKDFADQGTPLFADLNVAAPGLSKATVNLPRFAKETVPALTTLGDAAQTAGPKLAASDPLLTDLAATANTAQPVGINFGSLLDTFERTQGFQNLMNFIYNTTGSLNGFDQFGHYQRSNLQLSTCVEIVATPAGGCEAFWQPASTSSSGTKKKSKKARKTRAAKAKLKSASPLPHIDVPNLQDLLPPAAAEPGQTPGSTHNGSGTTTTTRDDTTTTTPDDTTTTTPDDATTGTERQGNQAVSMKSARMFLNFLLGGGA